MATRRKTKLDASNRDRAISDNSSDKSEEAKSPVMKQNFFAGITNMFKR
jgi:hypothetical protein